ncbi:MAG: hypothetical protein AAB152_08085 [Candidatus Coatesbacteria bacterium]
MPVCVLAAWTVAARSAAAPAGPERFSIPASPGMPSPGISATAPAGSGLPSAVPVSATTTARAPLAFSTSLSGAAVSGTAIQGAALSGTLVLPSAPSSTVQGSAIPGQQQPVAPRPSFTRTAAAAPAKPAPPPVPYEELHQKASLIVCPSAYAAHYKGPTGENAEVFLMWYIGTLYDERGLSIAPISTLFIGADLKWAFLSERGGRPAAAIGYLGGLEVPFTGGVVKVSTVTAQKQTKQSIVHDVYMVLSHGLGPLSLSAGALYGIKKAFPLILPMLRNPNFTTKPNPAPDTIWTAFGGADLAVLGRHFKVEVLTLPEVEVDRPWIVNTHLGGILGFDFAYLRDRIGWELLGYYQLPLYRWPDQKRLEKERDRMTAARRRP